MARIGKVLMALTLCGGIAGSVPASSRAAEARGSVGVSARVEARSLLETVRAPETVTVRPEDVARGAVEVPVPVRLTVYSNAPAGYLLVLRVDAPWVAGLRIGGLARPAEVSGRGGWLAQPHPGPHRFPVDLSFRIELAPDAAPGTYPWPVTLDARPRPGG
jgi:hypothetical protein